MKKLLILFFTLCIALCSIISLASCDKKETEKAVLKVGMECAYQPYNWTQQDDSNDAVPISGKEGQFANGYDVKIAKLIAEELNMELEIYAYEWDNLIPAVESSALDLIIAGMSPTDERKLAIDFTDAYYVSNLVVVVRKDSVYANATSLEDLSGARIVAQTATFHDAVVDQIPNVVHVTAMEDFPTMITALASKTIDGYVAEEPGAIADCNAKSEFTYIPLKNNENGFVIEDLSNVTLAIGVKKDSALLYDVNLALSKISEQKRAEIMEQAILEAQEIGLKDNTFFKIIGNILKKYGVDILKGVGYTMLIALVATIVGLLIGIIVGVIRTIPKSKNKLVAVIQKVVDFILSAYIEIFRGTPMMVQAMVIFWGYAFLSGGTTLPLLWSALFIVSINTGAYIAEIVRGGIISISKGQFEGARAIGMNHFQLMTYVVIPQVIRNILPAVSNEFVINIKDTSVLNVIGVVELFYQATIIAKSTYQIFATYTIICVVYFILTFAITRILRLVEKKLDGEQIFAIKKGVRKHA